MRGVVANSYVFFTMLRLHPGTGSEEVYVFCTGVLLKHRNPDRVGSTATVALSLKVALSAGSSKQGYARLASVGSNWVVAMVRVRPSIDSYVDR
jgi:hypothetical protein